VLAGVQVLGLLEVCEVPVKIYPVISLPIFTIYYTFITSSHLFHFHHADSLCIVIILKQ